MLSEARLERRNGSSLAAAAAIKIRKRLAKHLLGCLRTGKRLPHIVYVHIVFVPFSIIVCPSVLVTGLSQSLCSAKTGLREDFGKA